MIEVRYNRFNYKALLGNNMFQYCLGRILAERLGFQLRADAIPGFPNTTTPVSGHAFDGPEHRLSGQIIDLDAILADPTPRRIVLEGWFQRHQYYRPYREQIRQWLAFDPSIRRPATPPDVVVHVRRTDYVGIGWALPFSFYEEALERLAPKGGRVWILTDDRHDPFFRRFKKWRPMFTSGTAQEDLLFMSHARRIVMSQSTFSWWPTFLGTPDEVVCPLPSFGAWAPDGEAREARLIEADRFVCLPCPEPYVPSGLEARYQDLRRVRRRVVLGLNRRLGLSLPEPPV